LPLAVSVAPISVKYVTFKSPGELADEIDKDVWDIGLIGAEPQRRRKGRVDAVAIEKGFVSVWANEIPDDLARVVDAAWVGTPTCWFGRGIVKGSVCAVLGVVNETVTSIEILTARRSRNYIVPAANLALVVDPLDSGKCRPASLIPVAPVAIAPGSSMLVNLPPLSRKPMPGLDKLPTAVRKYAGACQAANGAQGRAASDPRPPPRPKPDDDRGSNDRDDDDREDEREDDRHAAR
jgi:hypothetical protein